LGRVCKYDRGCGASGLKIGTSRTNRDGWQTNPRPIHNPLLEFVHRCVPSERLLRCSYFDFFNLFQFTVKSVLSVIIHGTRFVLHCNWSHYDSEFLRIPHICVCPSYLSLSVLDIICPSSPRPLVSSFHRFILPTVRYTSYLHGSHDPNSGASTSQPTIILHHTN